MRHAPLCVAQPVRRTDGSTVVQSVSTIAGQGLHSTPATAGNRQMPATARSSDPGRGNLPTSCFPRIDHDLDRDGFDRVDPPPRGEARAYLGRSAGGVDRLEIVKRPSSGGLASRLSGCGGVLTRSARGCNGLVPRHGRPVADWSAWPVPKLRLRRLEVRGFVRPLRTRRAGRVTGAGP